MSNIEQLRRELLVLVEHSLAFDEDLRGKELLDRLARRIQSRFFAEEGSRGPFAENRGDYGARKRERGIKIGVGLYGEQIGGEMSQLEQFMGDQQISGDDIVWGFGLDRNADKGPWFHNGSIAGDDGTSPSGARNQPPRPFFELIGEDIDDAMDFLEARLAAALRA